MFSFSNIRLDKNDKLRVYRVTILGQSHRWVVRFRSRHSQLVAWCQIPTHGSKYTQEVPRKTYLTWSGLAMKPRLRQKLCVFTTTMGTFFRQPTQGAKRASVLFSDVLAPLGLTTGRGTWTVSSATWAMKPLCLHVLGREVEEGYGITRPPAHRQGLSSTTCYSFQPGYLFMALLL